MASLKGKNVFCITNSKFVIIILDSVSEMLCDFFNLRKYCFNLAIDLENFFKLLIALLYRTSNTTKFNVYKTFARGGKRASPIHFGPFWPDPYVVRDGK